MARFHSQDSGKRLTALPEALELEALVGSVVELGRITGTPTPTISAIYAAASLLNKTLSEARARLELQPAG